MVVMFEDGGTWVVGHETFRDDREREILWREGREGRKGKKNGLINSAQTALVFKDQICHFFYS